MDQPGSSTPIHLTIEEPRPGTCIPERVLLVCPRCGHPFLRYSAVLARGAWQFPCPACTAPLALQAVAGRSFRDQVRWTRVNSLVALSCQ